MIERCIVITAYFEGFNSLKKYEQDGEARGEVLATHRIAKSMLECGVDVDIVMKSSGLTGKEVENIKETI